MLSLHWPQKLPSASHRTDNELVEKKFDGNVYRCQMPQKILLNDPSKKEKQTKRI